MTDTSETAEALEALSIPVRPSMAAWSSENIAILSMDEAAALQSLIVDMHDAHAATEAALDYCSAEVESLTERIVNLKKALAIENSAKLDAQEALYNLGVQIQQ